MEKLIVLESSCQRTRVYDILIDHLTGNEA